MDNKVKVSAEDIDLWKLKKLLKYGDIKKIAQKVDCHHSYVSQVLNPKVDKYNADIIIAAVKHVDGKIKIDLDPEIAAFITKNGDKNVRKSASN